MLKTTKKNFRLAKIKDLLFAQNLRDSMKKAIYYVGAVQIASIDDIV